MALTNAKASIKLIFFLVKYKFFPNAKILIPFREPLQSSYFLLTQYNKFVQNSNDDKFVSKYMECIGRNEFGPNYQSIYNNNLIFKNPFEINQWIEQWNINYLNF